MEFIQSNVLLIGLVLGSGFMLLLPSLKKHTGGLPSLSAMESVHLINRSHAVVIDVREESEFLVGHIVAAIHIPLAQLPEKLPTLQKYKNKAILLYCQRGVRSVKACEILRKAEFSQVSHLQGGLDAWLEAKLPIVKNTEPEVA